MRRLFQFLYRFRVLIVFVGLEVASSWLIVRHNAYQGSKYFNSSNQVTASILKTSDDISSYFKLSEDNYVLAEENARLRTLLNQSIDSIGYLDTVRLLPSTPIDFITAKVINNSLFFQNNYITLDKGYRDGVSKGMGVIGPFGVVGKVSSVSERFSTVISLLHTGMMVSSTHKNSGALCTTKWDGVDPLKARIEYLPRHLEISIGDSIQTSGYNSIYPPGSMIGIIENISIQDDATFYDISIDLATDFYTLSHVYLVVNQIKSEKDSLESNRLYLVE